MGIIFKSKAEKQAAATAKAAKQQVKKVKANTKAARTRRLDDMDRF